MPTVEAPFGGPTFKRAIGEADGRHPSNDPLIIRDRGFEGLTIRVTGRTAAWYLRYKKVFYRLAPVGKPTVEVADREKGVLYTARDAKELADRLREVVDRGHDPKTYIAAWAESGTHTQATAAAGSAAAQEAGAWKWEHLVERFINDRIGSDKHLQHRVKPASPRTIKEVSDILRHPDLDHLKPKLARDLSRKDFEAIREKWFNEGRMGAQRKLITYTKSAYKWAKGEFAESGLADVAPWWSEMRHKAYASKAAMAKSRGEATPRTLKPLDIAKLLFIAEKNRSLPENDTPQRTGETTLAYLWWVCLTAQRTHAAASVRLSKIKDRLKEHGWYEVSWLPADVKSKRPHTLPISPEIYRRTIGRALAAPNRREGTIWAFPTNRVIKIEKGAPDRPVGDWILNNLLARLRGGRDGRHDLLAEAGLPHFTPHSMRKALTTFLTDQHLPPGTASAILDHAQKKSDDDEGTEEAEVTSKYYNESLRLPLKHVGLTKWATKVLEEYHLLIVAERSRHFTPLALTAAHIRRTASKVTPEHEHAWLFDKHLPDLPGQKPVAADPSKRTLNFGQLSRGAANDLGPEGEPDDFAHVG